MLNRIVIEEESSTRNKVCFSAMETSQFTFEQNFNVTPSAGKVMLTVFWDSHGVLLAHFQKRGENVNYTSYCGLVLKLHDAVRRKRSGQLARRVLLRHENARPHTVPATQKRIQDLQ
jgi:hypothetical protein